MRYCFVPGCDAYCKKKGMLQRKMFLPPAKQLESWKEVLPKKRLFKPHDRVCELHFEKEDIIEYWKTNIGGLEVLTQRSKPRLRDNAIPCKNLKKDECGFGEDQKAGKIEILSHKIITPAKRKVREKVEPAKSPKRIKKQESIKILIEQELEAPPQQVVEETINTDEHHDKPIEPQVSTEDDEKKREMFDNLYDEAFDVTMPSLLWGIHRDPERKFIAFSEFNQETLSASKIVLISDTLNYKTVIKSQLASSKVLKAEDVTTENFSTILDELEKEST